MPKSLDEILGMIQDPEAKSSLEATIADYNAKVSRVNQIEEEFKSKELVDRSIADGWRKFSSDQKPKLDAELKALREEVAKLRPEADRAAVLAKQIEGGNALDPKDVLPMVEKSFAGKYIPADQIDVIVQKAVKEATERVNFGSIPASMKILESADRARREYGLNIPVETFSEAVNRHGGIDQAYSALTADAARERSAKDAADREAKYKSDLDAAKEEGRRLGLRESETRSYSPEEGGSSGTMPMVTPPSEKDQPIDPTKYNPSDGVLARQASAMLAKQESEGLWGKQIQ